MRNRLRVLVFDVLAPILAIASLLYIGLTLGWPLWWVAVCSVLCLLAVQGVIVNVVLMRRDGVTVGTDDDRPGLRLAVTGLATIAVVAAVILGYQRWTLPDRAFTADSAEVVRIASSVSEATATFSPQNPTASIDQAAAQMVPERAKALKDEFAGMAKQLTGRNVSARASTVSAGVEAIGRQAASVAVVLRGTQSVPGQPVDNAVLALRVTLSKTNGRWMVEDVTPIHAR